jgi:DNA polymerase
MPNEDRSALISALQWHLDHGAEIPLGNQPENAFIETNPQDKPGSKPGKEKPGNSNFTKPLKKEIAEKAHSLAIKASSLDELKNAIESFDQIHIKKTAKNVVFSDGNLNAKIMLIGDAPGADEDLKGKPFAGKNGLLLDKILKSINLDREQNDPDSSVYISNILNWRPPGNRTPLPEEIETSLPFIERHISLVNPEILILAGGIPAQALLQSRESISKLRGKVHKYTPVYPDLFKDNLTPIPAIATYHPAYLLRTPSQKKAVWSDMLLLRKLIRETL